MSKFPIDLSHIRAVLFDVDGVLSRVTVNLGSDGTPIRTSNVRDGYAIQEAEKRGLVIGIISGGTCPSIPKRFSHLGVKHIYMQSSNKLDALEDFVTKSGIPYEECLFCGDDIPDIPVMKKCGFSIAPADAAPEVKAIAGQVLPTIGGEGVARAVIEEILKMKGEWMKDENSFGW